MLNILHVKCTRTCAKEPLIFANEWNHISLEPACCKKRPKIVPDSFGISLEYFRSFRCPLLVKPVTGQEIFIAVSNVKPAQIDSVQESEFRFSYRN